MRLSTTTCTIERTSTRTWMTQNKLRRGFEVRWSKITIPREFANASWPDPLPRRTEHDPLPCRRMFAFISRAALIFLVSSLSMILQRLAVVSKPSCSWPNVVTKPSGETRSSTCRFRSLPISIGVGPRSLPGRASRMSVSRPEPGSERCRLLHLIQNLADGGDLAGFRVGQIGKAPTLSRQYRSSRQVIPLT